ncbi:MAG: helix-turn-helix domain-containing protein [Lachnospiraceae bacterium]|jgi:carbohydrate diacid regulator|nr:helix-turn-helix domain-containing protein [Lachnospiraceae bacterium]
MIPSQILRNCLEELKSITKVDFCLADMTGAPLGMTAGMQAPDPALLSGFASTPVDSQIIGNCYLMKVEEDGEPSFVLAAEGSSENTLIYARIAVSEIQNMLTAYKEKYDRNNFFQNLLLDNLLLVDIYNRAKKLHIENNVPRTIVMIEVEKTAEEGEATASELLSGLYTAQNGDYLTAVDESSVILIKAVSSSDDYASAEQAATVAVDMLNTEALLKVRASYGTIVNELKDLSRSYKEAKMAMDVGRIFYAGKHVISYNSLGIGRLIYQLPVNLCRIFLEEVFGDNPPSNLDEETLTTINAFFDNNLNVSETSRQLFVHRNTLVYRIEKLQKNSGLDIRCFDDALTFKIALMVSSYLKYIDSTDY